ncbi:hypothetical protein PP182_14180 [Maribacter sp. PR1]|uniref:Lipocalin-like domain-containing protein n=1 Tax=Maribacter cobaltidurans TaxID=1178778 RepID=A0ABU7IWM5_9FLAO|nr:MULTISPECIES: hypothetical protein [Maribacter]MDC6389843.1 hypothetical protein [Maribacter sp. PR1]MEE1977233.1 hypothetical protein [Maribacter cobaltidurans]
MKRFLLLTLLIGMSCSHNISKEKLDLLNGYWEIQEVEFPNGEKKEYQMSAVVDYIQLDNLQGYKKKVVPKFDGSFETSDDAEAFKIIERNEKFLIKYENPLSEWEESLISLSSDNFSVKNPDGLIYHFKRFEPLKLDL